MSKRKAQTCQEYRRKHLRIMKPRFKEEIRNNPELANENPIVQVMADTHQAEDISNN